MYEAIPFMALWWDRRFRKVFCHIAIECRFVGREKTTLDYYGYGRILVLTPCMIHACFTNHLTHIFSYLRAASVSLPHRISDRILSIG